MLLPLFVTWILWVEIVLRRQRDFFSSFSDDSFLFSSFLFLGRERVKFIPLPFLFFYSQSDSNIIMMNKQCRHYYDHHVILYSPTFHVDCNYLTIKERCVHLLFTAERNNHREKLGNSEIRNLLLRENTSVELSTFFHSVQIQYWLFFTICVDSWDNTGNDRMVNSLYKTTPR